MTASFCQHRDAKEEGCCRDDSQTKKKSRCGAEQKAQRSEVSRPEERVDAHVVTIVCYLDVWWPVPGIMEARGSTWRRTTNGTCHIWMWDILTTGGIEAEEHMKMTFCGHEKSWLLESAAESSCYFCVTLRDVLCFGPRSPMCVKMPKWLCLECVGSVWGTEHSTFCLVLTSCVYVAMQNMRKACLVLHCRYTRPCNVYNFYMSFLPYTLLPS